MLWEMFFWETWNPTIHYEITLTLSTYLNIVVDQVYPFMTTVFLMASFSRIMRPTTLQKCFSQTTIK